MKKTKFSWKRLALTSIEVGLQKAVEILILVLLLGGSLKLIMAAVPAVSVGAVVTNVAKFKLSQ